MGRTNPTFRMVLKQTRSRWRDYRRGLRHHDQQHFDHLFEHADAHADAAGYLNPEDPMIPILVSMLLEHEKELQKLKEKLAKCKQQGDGIQD